MRRIVEFACAGETLIGSLDEGARATGLLIVSGGNEIRAGAHRGMSLLAQRLAASGVPVFRYDRRGIGDSTGTNAEFESTAEDIAAAADIFRREAGVARVVAFGNCDAASALALFHGGAPLDALVLSNPWTGGGGDDNLPHSAAIKARYMQRLRDPGEWLRLLRGGVDLRKLAGGLLKLAHRKPDSSALVDRMAAALAASKVPATILLARHDNTAVAFADAWDRCRNAPPLAIQMLDSSSHSYAGNADKVWLYDRLQEATRYSAA